MRSFVLILLLSLPLNLFSQIEKPIIKGNILLGGYMGASYLNNKRDNTSSKNKYFNISLSPNIGYFLINNLAIGAAIPLDYNWGKQSNLNNRTFIIGLGPYLKYYFNNGILLGIETTINAAFCKVDREIDSTTFKYLLYEISPSIGYAYFINQKVSLETSINYQYQRQTSEIDDLQTKNNSVNLNVGFQIFL